MMDAFFVRSRLSGWLDGDLSPREWQEVESALQADPALMAEADHLRGQLDAFRALKVQAPPELLAQLRLQPPPRRRDPTALAVALGFLTGILVYQGVPWTSREEKPAEPVLIAVTEEPGEAPTELAEAPVAAPDGAIPDGAIPDGAPPDGAIPDGAPPDGAIPGGAAPDPAPADRNIFPEPEPGAPGSAPREDWLHPRTPGSTGAAARASGSGPIPRSGRSGGTQQYLRIVGPSAPEPGWQSGGDGIAYQEVEPRELAAPAPSRPFSYHLIATDPELILKQLDTLAMSVGGTLLTSAGKRRHTGPMNPGDTAGLRLQIPATSAPVLVQSLSDYGSVQINAQPEQMPESGTVEIYVDVETRPL